MRNTAVIALDDGVISARTATLGSVPAPGQELFRLVRQQRLEWQAEVTDAELALEFLKAWQRLCLVGAKPSRESAHT